MQYRDARPTGTSTLDMEPTLKRSSWDLSHGIWPCWSNERFHLIEIKIQLERLNYTNRRTTRWLSMNIRTWLLNNVCHCNRLIPSVMLRNFSISTWSRDGARRLKLRTLSDICINYALLRIFTLHYLTWLVVIAISHKLFLTKLWPRHITEINRISFFLL